MLKIAAYTFAKGMPLQTFPPEPGVDYFAFSDGNVPAPWSRRPIQFDGPVYEANKYHKWHPHLLFPKYDYVIYMDATLVPTNLHGLVESIGKGSGSGINLAMHREHSLPVQELHSCMAHRRLSPTGYICASEYLASHHSKYPVPECTAIVYDMKRLSVPALEEIWRQYLICASHRDQLVVNYALEKSGHHPLRQQTLPGYIPMGKYIYGLPYFAFHPIGEGTKAPREVALLPATVISVPGNRTPSGCRPEYRAPLGEPALCLSGRQMVGYPCNGHHVLPSGVQGWLPHILKALGVPEGLPQFHMKKMQFGKYSDTVALPSAGEYSLYMDGKPVASGGAGVLTTPRPPMDAYHDLWWSAHMPSLTVRKGAGPDLLLIANSMVIPLLPLLAQICRKLAYIDNRGHRNLDWLRPAEYPYRCIIFDPKDSRQEHTAAEAISVLARQ